jgi:hypothetical protein
MNMNKFWAGVFATLALVTAILAIVLSCTVETGVYRHQGDTTFYSEEKYEQIISQILQNAIEIRMFTVIPFKEEKFYGGETVWLDGAYSENKTLWIYPSETVISNSWRVIYDFNSDSSELMPNSQLVWGDEDNVQAYHDTSSLILLIPSFFFFIIMLSCVLGDDTPKCKRNKKGQFVKS